MISVLALAVGSWSSSAAAFGRTTSCDASDDGPNANVWAFQDGACPHAGPPIMLH